MSSVQPRRTKADVVSEFRQTQILNAARACFGKHGLAAVTMDQIAKRARVAKGTIYLHYHSKEAILRDAIRNGISDLQEATVPAISAAGTLEQTVQRFFQATLTFFNDARDFYFLLNAELEPRLREEIRQEIRAVYAKQTDAWRVRLAAQTLRGGLDADDAARMIVSFAFGLSGQRLRGWTDQSVVDDATAATALVLKGLGS